MKRGRGEVHAIFLTSSRYSASGCHNQEIEVTIMKRTAMALAVGSVGRDADPEEHAPEPAYH